MISFAEQFKDNGYTILDSVLTEAQVLQSGCNLAGVTIGKAGTRNLLCLDWYAQLARSVKGDRRMASLLSPQAVAIQCTYFSKTSDRNWAVALHRDCTVPVKRRVDAQGWTGWSKKEGLDHVRPPDDVLESLVAVRLHLEDNTEENGPLQVVPGSHIDFTTEGERVTCLVPKGGALVMRPTILHASTKVIKGTRRVLHYVFGPRTLQDRVEWAYAV